MSWPGSCPNLPNAIPNHNNNPLTDYDLRYLPDSLATLPKQKQATAPDPIRSILPPFSSQTTTGCGVLIGSSARTGRKNTSRDTEMADASVKPPTPWRFRLVKRETGAEKARSSGTWMHRHVSNSMHARQGKREEDPDAPRHRGRLVASQRVLGPI